MNTKIFSIIFYKKLPIIYLLIFSIIALISLISGEVFDPSFNVASEFLPNNLLGYTGSYLRDIICQIFGFIGALTLFTCTLFFSVLSIWNKQVNFLKLRIFAAIILTVLNTLAFKYNSESLIRVIITEQLKINPNFFNYTLYVLGLPLILFIFNLSFIFKLRLFSTKAQTHFQPISAIKETIKKNKEQVIIQEKSKDISGFSLPSTNLLNKTNTNNFKLDTIEKLNSNAKELLKILNDFNIKGNIIDIHQGPVVTLYEFEPEAGTKSSRVIGLSDDIARSLCALSTRISVIPGRNALGIEIPNQKRAFFNLRELLETEQYNNPENKLPIVLGKDISGRTCVTDLAKMPHLLVAGTTGSGKSVGINSMIFSLLYKYTPNECKFIMIDPKMLELSIYHDIPHLLTPVVTEPSKAVTALKWAVKEMENRYRLMSSIGVRSIDKYNEKIANAHQKSYKTVQTGFNEKTGEPIYKDIELNADKLPYIVIIVDEMADLMLTAGKDIESSIQRLAQMARAAGIHLIMATQRPSVDVITGVIKANFPSRISFKVTSKIDSRTILGQMGAEQLLGMGDMLYMGTSQTIRVHGPFIDDEEVAKVTNFLKSQGKPEYVYSVIESEEEEESTDSSSDDDSLYSQAVKIVLRDKKPSTSYVQRSLRIGYNRAAIIIERMEKEGILSPPNHSGKREILREF